MKRYLLMLLVLGLFAPNTVSAKEKSITLDQALEVVTGYYDDFYKQDYWLLSERTEQWEIFVDEWPNANWAHDCAIYKFPNTGDVAVDIVPEIIRPEDKMPPMEEIEAIAVRTGIRGVAYGELKGAMERIWDATHTLTISESQLNEADFHALNDCVNFGKLGRIYMGSAELENNAIPDCAFVCYATNGGINRLQYISLPEGVETIGLYAFKDCIIENFTLPASVKTLGEGCFMNWEKVQWIHSKAITPPVCDGEEIFGTSTPKSIPIYVPVGSADAYRAAPGWDYFTTFIESDEGPLAGVDGIASAVAPKVYWANGVIVIEGATDSSEYFVYALDGNMVDRGVVVGKTACVEASNGVYIVKVGEYVRKVMR